MDLRSGTVLALCDFETTGLNPEKDWPIEVGILWLDSKFRVIGALDSVISNQEMPKWTEDQHQALRVHGILEKDLDCTREVVVADIIVKNNRLSPKRKVILCSDNAQFEYRFMKRLFDLEEEPFPFHYCTWDTSLLLEITGVGDPTPKHRAMADVGLVYKAILQARRKVRVL